LSFLTRCAAVRISSPFRNGSFNCFSLLFFGSLFLGFFCSCLPRVL
jgi:hypothetical protein